MVVVNLEMQVAVCRLCDSKRPLTAEVSMEKKAQTDCDVTKNALPNTHAHLPCVYTGDETFRAPVFAPEDTDDTHAPLPIPPPTRAANTAATRGGTGTGAEEEDDDDTEEDEEDDMEVYTYLGEETPKAQLKVPRTGSGTPLTPPLIRKMVVGASKIIGLNRMAAEMILKAYQKSAPGCFMIRESAKEQGSVVLSLLDTKKGIVHVKLQFDHTVYAIFATQCVCVCFFLHSVLALLSAFSFREVSSVPRGVFSRAAPAFCISFLNFNTYWT